MANRLIRTRMARAAAAVVVAFGVSLGGAVTFAPPAHAMLPGEPRSLTAGEIARLRSLEALHKYAQLQAMIANLIKQIGDTKASIVRQYR